MPCSISISGSAPARWAPGNLLWPLSWLGLLAASLTLLLWWLARVPGFREQQKLQLQLLSPLLSGNLALLTVTVASELWLAGRETRGPWWRVRLWAGGAATVAAASLAGIHAAGLWHSDTAVASAFVVPATLVVIAPFLACTAAMLGTTRRRGLFLVGYLLGAAAIIHTGVRVAARHPRGNYEAVLVACSLVMGLAIFFWLAVWSTQPVRGSA